MSDLNEVISHDGSAPESLSATDAVEAAVPGLGTREGSGAPSGATRRLRPRTVRIAVLVVALVAGALAYGGVLANERWGTRAMVSQAIVGIEAFIEGDADALMSVSNDQIRREMTPEMRQSMRDSGILAEFGAPRWDGDSATVKSSGGLGVGTLVAAPAGDGKNVVVYHTMGAISYSTGAVSLERTWSGWVITGVAAKPEAVPDMSGAATGSVEPTAAP